MLISQYHFDGPAEADGLPETHGPPKAHGSRGHSTPPLGVPGCSCKDIQLILRDMPCKKSLENLSLFSLLKFPKKGRDLPKLDWSQLRCY